MGAVTGRLQERDGSRRKGDYHRVCQGLWPSLMFADEVIEPQNLWALSKSHVATTYLCMHFYSNYIRWSNQGTYYEIEVHFAKQDVET